MRKKPTYSFKHYASCYFMMLTLVWLTISAPFNALVQDNFNSKSKFSPGQMMEENTNPYAGLSEEKGSGNGISEYLHEQFSLSTLENPRLKHASSLAPFIHLKYYGELVSPPPEA